MIINQNIQSAELPLPVGGSAAAPEIAHLPVYGNTLLKVWLYVISDTSYVKITDGAKNVIPISGYMHLVTNLLVDIDLEWKIEGPPWDLHIEAYNTDPAKPATLFFIAKYGDVREADNEYSMLQELTRIRELLEHKIIGEVKKEIVR